MSGISKKSWTTPAELEGILERITYHNPENGSTIARLQVRGQEDLVTVVGYFPQIQPGQTLKLWGSWKEHPQYGSQFSADRFQETQPATLTGIEKYLGSGLIKGVGPATAKRIVQHFGLETLQVIEQETSRLREVPGVGSYRVQRIEQAWQEQKSIKEVMLFLQSHGVSTTHKVQQPVPPQNTTIDCFDCKQPVHKTLSTRTHVCPHCGSVRCRDENAAWNILQKGLRLAGINAGVNTIGPTEINASGQNDLYLNQAIGLGKSVG